MTKLKDIESAPSPDMQQSEEFNWFAERDLSWDLSDFMGYQEWMKYIDKLEHALAEKDHRIQYLEKELKGAIDAYNGLEEDFTKQARELERLKNILASADKDHAVSKLMKELERLRGLIRGYRAGVEQTGQDVGEILVEKDTKYNDLLRTAVDLAEIIVGDRQCTYGGHEEALIASPQYKYAVTFLATPAAAALRQAKGE